MSQVFHTKKIIYTANKENSYTKRWWKILLRFLVGFKTFTVSTFAKSWSDCKKWWFHYTYFWNPSSKCMKQETYGVTKPFSSSLNCHKLISNKSNFIHGLPHEFPNNLRLRIIRNWKISKKSWNCVYTKPSLQPPSQKKILSIAVKKQISTFFVLPCIVLIL